ncbi:MAG: protease [Rubellimicrobium sp.]|nr:protease [Rubellimicrobium sp.]
MRSFLSVAVGLLALAAMPASALTFDRCTKAQIDAATEAVQGAKRMTGVARAAVGDHEHYVRWFGGYSPGNARIVEENLAAIDLALGAGALTLVCPALGEEDCWSDTFANVWPDEPFVINLCPAFFRMPGVEGFGPRASGFQNGTREGTIIHEISHFDVIAGTDDECYSRRFCASMARLDPRRAIRNADSYQYFVEDVYLLPDADKE